MDWQVIEEFPMYMVHRDGTIKHADTEYVRRPSSTQEGASKITLFKHGRPYTRSHALIVAKAHLYNDHDPEIFDTPIHLDNDPMNNHVDNLMWRPRWFAVKYQRQYWNTEFRYAKLRVEDLQTNVVYDSLVEPCQTFGLLYIDILNSCNRGTYVFPTWKTFQYS